MAKSVQKISLSASRDIPFDRLVLSQSNVRHVKAGVSIDELAADIARRTLLQSLTVRPVLDADGTETGMYEIPLHGRRALRGLRCPRRITDVALQPGEQLVGSGPVAAGDTVRWIICDTTSGTGARAQVHILVKPTRPDLTTNLIVNTDRRTYHLELAQRQAPTWP